MIISKHEKIAADFLAVVLGNDVTFLEPNRQKGAKTPDITMGRLRWEIKSPTGKSSRTIENNLRLALKQSAYIVLDLRRMDGRLPTKKLLREVERQFKLTKALRRVITITREDTHIDFVR